MMKFVNKEQSYLQVTKLREAQQDGTMEEYLRIELYEKETGLSIAFRLNDPRIISDLIEVAQSVYNDIAPAIRGSK